MTYWEKPTEKQFNMLTHLIKVNREGEIKELFPDDIEVHQNGDMVNMWLSELERLIRLIDLDRQFVGRIINDLLEKNPEAIDELKTLKELIDKRKEFEFWNDKKDLATNIN